MPHPTSLAAAMQQYQRWARSGRVEGNPEGVLRRSKRSRHPPPQRRAVLTWQTSGPALVFGANRSSQRRSCPTLPNEPRLGDTLPHRWGRVGSIRLHIRPLASSKCDALAECEFHDFRWTLVEVTEPDPLRSRAHIGQSWPRLSIASVWKSKEVTLLEALKV